MELERFSIMGTAGESFLHLSDGKERVVMAPWPLITASFHAAFLHYPSRCNDAAMAALNVIVMLYMW